MMPSTKSQGFTEEDIRWVVKILNLPDKAFSDEQDGGARNRVLKSINETLDISACPGSGKTTLLVAKLALLVRKWPHKRRGICVLSHTNVAKNEIKNKLGGTEVGQALLSYPHYIGTIHGFVNEFLALPWLRSKGIPINTIDTNYAHIWRWNALPDWLIENAENAHVSKSSLTVKTPDCSIGDVRWAKGILGKDKRTYKLMTNACKKSIEDEGIHTFDEMFVWAQDFVDENNHVTRYIRERFPTLLIDEVQDNSELQSSMLHKIFMEGSLPVCRMRFGDIDQAIFNYAGDSETVHTDSFPSNKIGSIIELPNSYRFGPSIAKLASPLSIDDTVLVGQGTVDEENHHAIFLVDDDCVGRVLDFFGKYVLTVFKDSQEALDKMRVTAVGAVHRNNGTDRIPRHVVHYWPKYDPEIANQEPKPSTFMQYVMSGFRKASSQASEVSGGNVFTVIESIASGIFNKAKEVSTKEDFKSRKRKHRYMIELLEEFDESALDDYMKIVTTLAIDRDIPDAETWKQVWVKKVANIVFAMSGTKLAADDPFFAFPDSMVVEDVGSMAPNCNNTYQVEYGGRNIDIHLSSIHAVKGETHTATLALETYSKAHHLEKLLNQLKGKRATSATEALKNRLRLHYVAMTRPTRLLCLAMKKDTLTDKKTGIIKERDIKALKKQGWKKIGILNSSGGCDWL